MKKTNALEMRRSLGRVLEDLARDDEPILVERNREPAAVLISLRDFRERFVDKVAAEERERLAEEILALRSRATKGHQGIVQLVRELRGPLLDPVLDASVAMKWLVPDGDATDAMAIRVLRDVVARPNSYVVPELFFHECLAVLCRRMGQANDVVAALERLSRLGLRRIRLDKRTMRRAAKLAFDYRISGYDACYAALAHEIEGKWLTFDAAAHERIATLGISEVPDAG